jgi:hypothetical protein
VDVGASLLIGEQFVSDLQTLFPALRVVPTFAIKIDGVLSNTRGAAPTAGFAKFALSSLTPSLQRVIVIAVSHSGQTFPALHATHLLRRVCGDFVLTGAIDVSSSQPLQQPWRLVYRAGVVHVLGLAVV